MKGKQGFTAVMLGLALSGMAGGLHADGEPGKFDYYVMSLSWSPDYCASSPSASNNDPQCAVGKKLGFVLHGVWPQYNRGYPSDCSDDKMPESLVKKYQGLYPSKKLYFHEWEKHGTCSGLTPDKYLSFSQQLKGSLAIPANYDQPAKPFRVTADALKKDFIAANPALQAGDLSVFCSGSGRFLQELRVCYSQDGKPAECGKDVLASSRKSCGQPDFLVRSIK
ncbi:ribonuclease [Candidatus Thiothrix sp. Deng01]|uniref:Ribonuclease n=1 Tax=Candidatus Thiothrix phosphatis TaxID=3112415 RepID=A0ABU6CZY6_9GAMM|nr:hypothetical protein [Candidatus Thiothrix sp. Deng01]MEB4591968.1 ribonuclease [Candidatus Thiothrix sp. Deng01]